MLVLMPVKIHPGWLRPIGFCYGESRAYGSRREADRTRSESFGGRFAHAGDDAQIRRWMARPGTRRHEHDPAHVLAAADPTTAQDGSSPAGNQPQGRVDDDNAANAKDE